MSLESLDKTEQEEILKSQLKELTRENESRKESINSYLKQITSFQELKKELESQISILSSQLNQSTDLKSKLINYEQEKQRLWQDNSSRFFLFYETLLSNFSDLRHEIDQVKTNHNNMVIENSELNEKVALLNEKISQINLKTQNEINAKTEELNRSKNELSQIKKRYQDQEKFESEILANNKSNIGNSKNLNLLFIGVVKFCTISKVATISRKLCFLKTIYFKKKIFKGEINRLKNELKKSLEQISDLENEIKSLTLAHQCQIVQLKDSFREKQKKNDQWPEKLEAELKKEREKHSQSLQQLEAEMKKNFTMELEIHNQKYDELYVKYQKIISDNQSLSKETLNKLEADNKHLANELKNVHEEKLKNEKKLRQELENLRAITKDLHERLEKYSEDDAEDSIQNLKQKVIDKETTVNELGTKLKQSEVQIDQFKDEVRFLLDNFFFVLDKFYFE